MCLMVSCFLTPTAKKRGRDSNFKPILLSKAILSLPEEEEKTRKTSKERRKEN
jgi:hypothetical protein